MTALFVSISILMIMPFSIKIKLKRVSFQHRSVGVTIEKMILRSNKLCIISALKIMQDLYKKVTKLNK